MKSFKTSLFLLVGLFLLTVFAVSAVSTTAATTYTFTVNNRTSKTLEVTLLGAENYVISAPPVQKTSVDVIKGVYQYSYYDCGKLNIGTVNMNNDKVLKITSCNSSGGGTTSATTGMVEIVLNNLTNKRITVAFVGEQNYSFDLTTGKNRVEVFKGTYQMSYYDCGQLNISTVKINKDDYQIKFLDCGKLSDGGESGGSINPGVSGTNSQETVVFFIKNETRSTLTVSFLSNLVYTFTAPPGKTKIAIVPDEYQYSYYACGQLWIGHMNINRKNEDIRITNCGSKSGAPDTGQEITFKVKNQTHSRFTLYLYGPRNYELLVRGGKSSVFEIEKGYYSYKYTACGGTYEGEVYIRNGLTWKTVACPDN